MPSKVTGRKYLGVAPSAKAMQRLRERLRQILHRGNVAPWTAVAKKLNQILRGWANYFSYGSVGRAYDAVNWAVLERTRYILRKRHRVGTSQMWRQFSGEGDLRKVRGSPVAPPQRDDAAVCCHVKPVGEPDAFDAHVRFDERR